MQKIPLKWRDECEGYFLPRKKVRYNAGHMYSEHNVGLDHRKKRAAGEIRISVDPKGKPMLMEDDYRMVGLREPCCMCLF